MPQQGTGGVCRLPGEVVHGAPGSLVGNGSSGWRGGADGVRRVETVVLLVALRRWWRLSPGGCGFLLLPCWWPPAWLWRCCRERRRFMCRRPWSAGYVICRLAIARFGRVVVEHLAQLPASAVQA